MMLQASPKKEKEKKKRKEKRDEEFIPHLRRGPFLIAIAREEVAEVQLQHHLPQAGLTVFGGGDTGEW